MQKNPFILGENPYLLVGISLYFRVSLYFEVILGYWSVRHALHSRRYLERLFVGLYSRLCYHIHQQAVASRLAARQGRCLHFLVWM